MFFQVVLIYFGGFVQANLNEDIGNIPYENLPKPLGLAKMPVPDGDYGKIPYDKAKPLGLAKMPVPDGDYGKIPYDKAPAKNDVYGNIPYEDALKPDVQVDYGNIPYDKVVGLTPRAENRTKDIPEILLDMFKGRDVPGLTLTTMAEGVTPRASELSTQSTTNITTNEVAIQFRAPKEETEPEYHSPGTIDDSDCNPRISSCSTCRDKDNYRIYCLNGTTTAAPSDLTLILKLLVKITDVYWSNNYLLSLWQYNNSMYNAFPKHQGWPFCPTTTPTTATPSPTWPPHNFTGQTIAKCFVCGMLDSGIPQEDRVCSDSFLSHAYRKHCKFLNRDGWHINGSGGFYMWGRWTGGCSLRFTDISTVYHQRTCRDNVNPAQGHHYVSRRMAQLEYALRKEKDACVASPTASLVPLSRGVSLFSRFHVCVCSRNYCNHADRVPAVLQWYMVAFAFAYFSLRFYEALQGKLIF